MADCRGSRYIRHGKFCDDPRAVATGLEVITCGAEFANLFIYVLTRFVLGQITSAMEELTSGRGLSQMDCGKRRRELGRSEECPRCEDRQSNGRTIALQLTVPSRGHFTAIVNAEGVIFNEPFWLSVPSRRILAGYLPVRGTGAYMQK